MLATTLKLRLPAACLACALILQGTARAQDPKPAAEGKLTPIYFGTESCIQCHRDGSREKVPLVCRCTEVVEWQKDLRHPKAYQVLKEQRAARIGQLLHINVTEDQKCLSCHGVYIADKDLRARSIEAGFKPEEGVSCVACHGAFEEWANMHGLQLKRREWRKLNREEKEKKYGMVDLWNPERRVQVCASCHVGNVDQSKVITHDMYAAGHPPLPSFEVAAFGERMPRHWELLAQKSPAAKTIPQYDGTSLEQSRLTVEGSVAVFREAMKLLAADAAQSARQSTRLDFARFD